MDEVIETSSPIAAGNLRRIENETRAARDEADWRIRELVNSEYCFRLRQNSAKNKICPSKVYYTSRAGHTQNKV